MTSVSELLTTMRASPQEATGTAGLSDVMGNFERIGWGPVPNTLHDLGTDLFILARDERRFDRRLLVGAQVKAGPSAFDSPVKDDAGEVVGWDYYEPGTDHFEAWVRHGLPHLLVLADLDSRVSYWVHVTAEAVTSTGKGMKITVPATQTVDSDHLGALLEVAANQRVPVPLEGTAWTAGVEKIAPAGRLRHAMLVPRLVAPHPNTGTAKELAPEEGLAVLAQGRVSGFEVFSEAHRSVPSLQEAADHPDWRWRFVAAFGRYVLGRESRVAGLLDDAPSRDAVSAAQVLQACELFDGEEYDAALETLTGQVDRDKSDPVDQAWMVMHRARIRADTGDVKFARGDAAAVHAQLVGDEDDFTASALRAAAGWLLFQTAPWADRRLGDMIAATDTAVSWWRSQAISAALTEAETRVFRRWADEQTVRFDAEDMVNNRLYAAHLGAHLAGEQGAWRASGSLLARNTIMTAHAKHDDDRLRDGIDDLRRSGDAANVALAAQRIWAIGPLPPLSTAATAVTERSWTHTAAQANLRLWQGAGDLLPAEAAVEATRWCLGVLADPSGFAKRIHPSFLIESAVLDALPPLVRAGGPASQHDMLAFVTGLPDVTDPLAARGWAGVLFEVHSCDLDEQQRTGLRAAAARQSNTMLSAVMLAPLVDEPDVLAALLARARDGDLDALAGIERVDRLDQAAAKTVLERETETIRKIAADADKGSHSTFGHDPIRTFTVVAASLPEHADWDPLIRLLGHPAVLGGHKRSACMTLAALADRLPQPVRDELVKIIPAIRNVNPDDTFIGKPLAGADRYVAAALGALDEHEFAHTLASLINGSRHDRKDAARLVSLDPDTPHVSVPVALFNDPHGDVRAAAATALAKLATSPQAHTNPLISAGVEQALLDPGAQVPLGFAHGLSTDDSDDQRTRDIVSRLTEHPSALVRYAATDTLHQCSP